MLSLVYGNSFHSHRNKTHFHKKGCALGLILKVRVFGLGVGLELRSGLLPSLFSVSLESGGAVN